MTYSDNPEILFIHQVEDMLPLEEEKTEDGVYTGVTIFTVFPQRKLYVHELPRNYFVKTQEQEIEDGFNKNKTYKNKFSFSFTDLNDFL